MGRNDTPQQSREGVISIIGPGMQVVGDCRTEGTLRIEGSVKGTIHAGKAVVLGKDGRVDGDISTQDAVIGGHVAGSIVAESRLELQATCTVEGEIRARRLKLDEGGKVNGTIQVGDASAARAGGPAVAGVDAAEPAAAAGG
jgi:cytoskeletal protein CcmA (bactofilin family)